MAAIDLKLTYKLLQWLKHVENASPLMTWVFLIDGFFLKALFLKIKSILLPFWTSCPGYIQTVPSDPWTSSLNLASQVFEFPVSNVFPNLFCSCGMSIHPQFFCILFQVSIPEHVTVSQEYSVWYMHITSLLLLNITLFIDPRVLLALLVLV